MHRNFEITDNTGKTYKLYLIYQSLHPYFVVMEGFHFEVMLIKPVDWEYFKMNNWTIRHV